MESLHEEGQFFDPSFLVVLVTNLVKRSRCATKVLQERQRNKLVHIQYC
jgi:hypothetical protein